MHNTANPSLDEFEEEKLLSLQDSLSMSPNIKPSAQTKLSTIQSLSPKQPAKAEQCSPGSKGGRHRKCSLQDDKNMNRGHWQLEENKKYHWFLEIHYKHFVNRHMRRMDKIFKTMETFIGTRQAEQCRSHHQKMEKKYHNFITIIANLRHQHYSTEDIEPIAQDIEESGVRLGEPLATIAMLREEELASSVVTAETGKQRRKGSLPKGQEIEIEELMNPPELEEVKQSGQAGEAEAIELVDLRFDAMNILEESNLNMGELRMYHQKEDNSFFFNFH